MYSQYENLNILVRGKIEMLQNNGRLPSSYTDRSLLKHIHVSNNSPNWVSWKVAVIHRNPLHVKTEQGWFVYTAL